MQAVVNILGTEYAIKEDESLAKQSPKIFKVFQQLGIL